MFYQKRSTPYSGPYSGKNLPGMGERLHALSFRCRRWWGVLSRERI